MAGTGGRDGPDQQADDWLIGRARTGDVDAYEVLVRRHRTRIYRTALRMLSDPDDAEDVAQDVVIQLWRALAGFAGESSFTTWLYRIVVNRRLSTVRRRKPTRPILEADAPVEAAPRSRCWPATARGRSWPRSPACPTTSERYWSCTSSRD